MHEENECCDIRDVGKRRDGGHRYWCVRHRADATAKYGVPAQQCVAAHDEVLSEQDILELIPADYPGGIAVWGAVPAVYDSSTEPVDRGIHVHARLSSVGKKEIDRTFRRLKLLTPTFLGEKWVEVDEIDAINYMVSTVFGFPMKYVECTLCGFPHLDRDWFAVHRHKRHLCHGCGRKFSDVEEGVGNPAVQLHQLLNGRRESQYKASQKRAEISQADYPGGIRLWGSNPAIAWTSETPEEVGIHLHADDGRPDRLALDDTFESVCIDGIEIDAVQLRVYMAQCTLPHIRDRVLELICTQCGTTHFDQGVDAYTPHIEHTCHECGSNFMSNHRLKRTIGNPFAGTRLRLAANAVRPLQTHFLDLRIESI